MEKLRTPNYLFCELPIKDGSINDQRQFIYCPKYLSLIEIIAMDDIISATDRNITQKQYSYQDEDFLLVFSQNNVEMVNQSISGLDIIKGTATLKNEMDILDEAWAFYQSYLLWEDSQF